MNMGETTEIPKKLTTVPKPEETEMRVVFEDFNAYTIGVWPNGWVGGDDEAKHNDAVKRQIWKVGEEKGNRFAYLAYEQAVVNQLARKIENWNIREFPTMEWRWRVNKLPPQGAEYGEINDSAAQIIILFKRNLFSWRSLRYTWSTTLPAGTERPYETSRAKHKFIVMQSGTEKANQWVTERVDVLEDYRKAFGATEKPPKVFSVIFRSDSDGAKELIAELPPGEKSLGVPTGASYDDLTLVRPFTEEELAQRGSQK